MKLKTLMLSTATICLLAACSNNSNDNEFKKKFINSCSTDVSRAFCSCLYERLEKDVGVDTLIKEAKKSFEGKAVSDSFARAAAKGYAECMVK